MSIINKKPCELSSQEIRDLTSKYLMPNYRRLPVTVVRGQGSRVWDADGKEYLDLFPGWGVSGLGHCHPRVVEAVREQAGRIFHMANNFQVAEQAYFAQILSTKGSGQQCFFSNSGAEANEGAIKLARLYCQPKYKIITLMNSFHGRTFAAISATGQPSYQAGFTPVVPGFSYAILNDFESVKALVDDETAAIMVEPVQGEGGVIACDVQFLQSLRKLCTEKNMLLIFDEVQTSPARLGTWFGYQHFGVVPDIMTSAKSIAGGMPMGLIMARPEVAAALKPGTHASTFGGNSIGCAAGIATFQAIEEDGMLGNIKALGPVFDQMMGDLANDCSCVKAVRRTGFMIGIELAFDGAEVVQDCMDNGLLINCTHGTVLRMLPAFNITKDEISRGFEILGRCLKSAVAKNAGALA